MAMEWWWAYLTVGAVVGFFSGLLGIGGGSAIVPLLTFIFTGRHVAPDYAVHLALGTAMASILFTSASSVWSHHQRAAVSWRVVRELAPGAVVGTFGGALLAGRLSAVSLSIVFTVLVYYVAAQLGFGGRPAPSENLPGRPGMWLAGGAIGVFSSLAAIAGASLTVPFLVKRNVAVHTAIGTAAAVGWPLALAGTAGYIVSGAGKSGLPDYSAGFVYLPALVWIVVASVLVAPLGAMVAHRTPGTLLRKIFALLLFTLATKMLWSLVH